MAVEQACVDCEGTGLVPDGRQCPICFGTGVAPETLPAVVVDEVTLALAEVTTHNVTITQLAEKGRELALRYAGVVADVRTVKGYESIAAIRKELRDEVRYPMQDLKKTGSKILGTMQRQFNARCEELVAEAERHELPFHEMLVAEDQRKATEKREREEAEQRRKDGHTTAIATIAAMVTNAIGLGVEDLQAQLDSAKNIIVDEGYEEFQGQAQQAKDEAVRRLESMVVAAVADEMDRQEAEDARARQAAFAQQQAAERAAAEAREKAALAAQEKAEAEATKLRARLAILEAEQAARAAEQERAARERAEAIDTRIAFFNELVADASERSYSADRLEQMVSEVDGKEITADLFGERTQEAGVAKAQALDKLIELRCAASDRERHEEEARQQREREEAVAAQRKRREELLAMVIGAGNNALLAVEDGSADVALLEENLQKLRDLEMSEEVWAEFLPQAMQAQIVACSAAEGAIIMTKERDRLRAEEEAERKKEQIRLSVTLMRAQMMRDNAGLLFDAAAALVDFIERHIVIQEPHTGNFNRLTDDVRGILRRVPKE